jgi:hypothetical protein
VLLAVAALAGCRQILGIGNRMVSPPPTCGIWYSDTSSCEACVEANCCQPAVACASSDGGTCLPLEKCLAECEGEPACRSGCAVAHKVPNGADQTAAGLLESCLATSCEAECGLACGGLSQVAGRESAVACQSKIVADHCTAAQTCARDPDCMAQMRCRESCVTGDCVGACNLARPGGDELYEDFVRPLQDFSDPVCEIGGNWTCVGKVAWPTIMPPDRSLKLGFVDWTGAPAPAGLAVALCAAQTPTCAAVGQGGMTSDGGQVTVVDPRDPSLVGQGLGYLDIESGELSSGPLMPTLIYWGFPLSRDGSVLTTPVPLVDKTYLADLVWAQRSAELDPALGHVGVAVLDCLGIQAPRVAVTLKVGTQVRTDPIYTDGSALFLTGKSGIAVFPNVTPGMVTVTATPAATGRPVATLEVFVRADAVTEIGLAPTP